MWQIHLFEWDQDDTDNDDSVEQLLFVQRRQCTGRSSWRLWQLYGQHDCHIRSFLLRTLQGDEEDGIGVLMVEGAVSPGVLAF